MNGSGRTLWRRGPFRGRRRVGAPRYPRPRSPPERRGRRQLRHKTTSASCRQRRAARSLIVSSVGGRTVFPSQAAYAATKWALEAFGETLALELSGFGIDVTLAEPGPISSGALDDVLSYNLPDDPYAALLGGAGIPAEMMSSPEQVAAVLADLVERPEVPLRVPVGPVVEHMISARNSAPWDRPFVLG